MFRKKDLVIIAGVLLAALIGYGAIWLSRANRSLSGIVNISVDGKLFKAVPMGEGQTVRVEQENGAVNIVEITQKGVRMDFSSCRNQLCVHQGEVTVDNWIRRSMGRSIVCLPNRVVVELALDQGTIGRIEEDLPDV